jgi:hypothetical protein
MRQRHPFLFWLGAFWFLRHFLRHGRRGGFGYRGYGPHRRHFDYI